MTGNDKESHAIGARCKFLGALFSTMHRCMVCGKAFAYSEELELHGMRVHNSDKEECMLLRKAGEEEKARKRSRGPYRKSHMA
jgi:hypothetical protein